MKSEAPSFYKFQQFIYCMTAKTATGNGNFQPEIKVTTNEYSSTRGSPIQSATLIK